MISVIRAETGNNDEIHVYLKGSNVEIAEEFAALSIHLTEDFPDVLDIVQIIIDNERIMRDEKEK